jgi:hypothetical protein
VGEHDNPVLSALFIPRLAKLVAVGKQDPPVIVVHYGVRGLNFLSLSSLTCMKVI